jgi:hypothetical protein
VALVTKLGEDVLDFLGQKGVVAGVGVSLSHLGGQVPRAVVRRRREAGLPSCYRVLTSQASRVRRSRPSVKLLLIEEVCNFLRRQSVVARS